MFRQTPFSGCRKEVKNVSANEKRPGPSWFSIGSKNLVEEFKILLSVKLHQRFKRNSRKYLSQSKARAAIFFLRSSKNANLVITWSCLSCFSKFQRSQKCLSQLEVGWGAFCFSNRPEKHKRGRDRWDLASCQVSADSVRRFQRRSWKWLSRSETGLAILFFNRPEKHKLDRGRWVLSSCLHSVLRFQRSNGTANQRPCCGPKKYKVGRGRWLLASCEVSANSVRWFQRRSQKGFPS